MVRKDKFMEYVIAIYIVAVLASFAVLMGWWLRHG
jgi:hypothetical protein